MPSIEITNDVQLPSIQIHKRFRKKETVKHPNERKKANSILSSHLFIKIDDTSGSRNPFCSQISKMSPKGLTMENDDSMVLHNLSLESGVSSTSESNLLNIDDALQSVRVLSKMKRERVRIKETRNQQREKQRQDRQI